MMQQHNINLPKQIIFWGGTGQAITNFDILNYLGIALLAIIDDTLGMIFPLINIPIIF